MIDWTAAIELPVYDLLADEKSALFEQEISRLFHHHYQRNTKYRDIIDTIYPDVFKTNTVPALAVRLFKHHLFSSIDEQDIAKITTSSGTTSQQVSRIVLDKENILRQQRVLAKIVQHWLGKKRLPMLIIDHPNVIKDKFSYSARGVGIQGLSLFGHHHTYALNDDMTINFTAVNDFIEQYKNEPVFVFGFTFMIWQYFIKPLAANRSQLNLSQAKVLHSGGWKKLQDQAVSNDEFKRQLTSCLGAKSIHNFYGMVEQTGSIFVECEAGHLHCSVWSDIKIRRFSDLSIAPLGEEGIVEVSSLLPTSYPGHVILTEDIGTILGVDDCPCGKNGRYFSIRGRLAAAEVRGCSDTQS